jgi:chromosome partitioning protein
MLSKLLIDDIEIHDSPRAVDIDEDQAPITAPYTELKDNDRFAIESLALGEFVFKKILGEKEDVNQEENNHELTYV